MAKEFRLQWLAMTVLATAAASSFGGCSDRAARLHDEATGQSTDPLQTPVGPSGRYEPAIAINPTNPLNIAVSSGRGLMVSTDYGATFTSEYYFPNNGTDASLAFDSRGRLFATWLYAPTTCCDVAVQQFNSTTGAPIGSLTNVSAALGVPLVADRQWITADRFVTSHFRDRLYVVWGSNPGVELFAYSADQGATWHFGTAPGNTNQLSLAGEGRVFQNHAAVAANGDVYVAYHSQPTLGPDGEPNGTTGHIILLRSTDGGSNFTQRTLPYGSGGAADVPYNIQSDKTPSGMRSLRLVPHNSNFLVGSGTPWILPDPRNLANVAVIAADDVWNDDTVHAADINAYIARSTDSGVNFAISQVDLGPVDSQQIFPTGAADDRMPCLAAMWLDNRAGQPAKGVDGGTSVDYKLDLIARGSPDNGVTFGSEVQVDDTSPLEPDWNAPPNGGPPPVPWTLRIGEYNGMVVSKGVAHAAWVGTDSSGQQHIMYNAKRVCTDAAQPPTGGNVAAVRQSANVTAVFAFGSDGALYDRSYSGSTGVWTQPQPLTSTSEAPAGAGVAAVATVLGSTPVADVLYVANDKKVRYAYEGNDGAWTQAGDVPNQPTNFAPAGARLAATWFNGQLGVWVIDNNGALQALWWNPSLGWQGPAPLTAANYAPPGAALATGVRASGEFDVFAIGSDGALKYMAYSGGAWSGPWPLTVGNFAPPGGSVATSRDNFGILNVFTIASDGALYTKWDASPLWAGPSPITATHTAPPGGAVSAVQYNGLALDAFYVANTGVLSAVSNSGSWQGPFALSSTTFASPGAATAEATQGSTQLDLFSVANLGLFEASYAGAWSSNVPLP